MANTCSLPECTAPTFLDDDRCFDHQRVTGTWLITVAASTICAFALCGVAVWAVIKLVLWVTTR